MNQISSKDRLKDKFSKLEIAIDDEELGFKITKESLKDIRPVSETEKRKKTNVPKLVFRVVKLACSSFYDFSLFIYQNILSVAASYLFTKSKLVLKKVHERGENAEIFVDRKITSLEIIKQSLKEAKELKISNIKATIENYYSVTQSLFCNLIEENDYKVPEESYEEVERITKFQMKIMELISRKLVVSNMIANIRSINIKAQLNDQEVITLFRFEMDKKGHVWSKMFGKSIVPEINALIEVQEGKLFLKQIYNYSTKKDVFLLKVNYQAAEVKKIEEIVVKKEQEFDLLNDNIFNEYRL